MTPPTKSQSSSSSSSCRIITSQSHHRGDGPSTTKRNPFKSPYDWWNPPTHPPSHVQSNLPHTWAANPLCLQENYRFRWSLNWWVADSLLSPTTSSSRRTNERTCQRQTTFRGTWWTNKTDNKGASSQISMTIKSHQTKTLWIGRCKTSDISISPSPLHTSFRSRTWRLRRGAPAGLFSLL